MDFLEAASMLARFGVAAMLLVSSTAKLRSGTAFRTVLRQLGLSRVRFWWLAVCAVELAIAAVVLVPMNPFPVAGLVGLVGVAFAGAGVRALSSGRSIRCACFGSGHAADLGWPQLVALPLWLLAAVALTWWQPVGVAHTAALMTAVFATVLSVMSVRLFRLTRQARTNRIAILDAKRRLA